VFINPPFKLFFIRGFHTFISRLFYAGVEVKEYFGFINRIACEKNSLKTNSGTSGSSPFTPLKQSVLEHLCLVLEDQGIFKEHRGQRLVFRKT
jgi:hypothetical protein